MEHINKSDIPKPLLKWVGGKSQIIDTLMRMLPKNINNYHELFVGGGSFLIMILWARSKGLIDIKGHIFASDLNEALIGFYNNVKCRKDELYEHITDVIAEFDACPIDGPVIRKSTCDDDRLTSKESYYYWIRKMYNEDSDKSNIKSSSYFLFLNKTNFRGMYREGPNGYNVPYGNNKNPGIINSEALNYISDLIQDVTFTHCDFHDGFANVAGRGDFVYLDPPYAPESDKSFVGYTKDGFDIKQHELLFQLTNEISKKNRIMMSNASVQLVRTNLSYEDYIYDIISCRRAINSSNPAAKTDEVIITNY